MHTLANILDKIFSDPALRTHYQEAKVLTMYPQTVGEEIARISRAQSFHQGVLIVKVSSAAWRNELNLMRLQIKESLNSDLHEKLVKKIVFR